MPLQQIHYPVALEVHHDRGGAVAPLETEVVHAHHTHISALVVESAPDAVQEGVGTDEESQLSGKPRSGLAAQRECDPLQSLPLAIGAAREGLGHLIQALGEDPALAGRLVAEELAHPDPQAHRCATPGKVGQRTGVETMDPARSLAAHRTMSLRASQTTADGQRVSVEGEGVYVQSFGDGEAGEVPVRVGHEFPPGELGEIVWKSHAHHLEFGRSNVRPLWEMLYAKGADVILSG